LIAIGGVYQYYFDPSIGNYMLYVDNQISTTDNPSGVTLRATSFIGSPQMLSFILGITLFDVVIYKNTKFIFPLIFLLFCYAGLLSGSASFGGALLLFLIAYVLNVKKNYLNTLFFSILTTILIFVYAIILEIESDTAMLNSLKFGLTSHIEYYQHMFSNINITIFGNGLGSANRLSEIYLNIENIYNDKFIENVESYLLAMIHESGIFGFLVLLSIVVKVFFITLRKKEYFKIMQLVYLLLNMLFTPVMTGVTGIFIGSFYLLRPLFHNSGFHKKYD